MKKKVILMWILFVICVIATVALRYFADREQVQFEEVTAKVLDAQEREYKYRKTGTSRTSYDVTVEYNGEEYTLKNAYNVYQYPRGKEITAYMSRGSLYANIEGVKSSTPLFYSYFAFLVSSVVLFGVAINETVKAKRK